MVAAGLASMNFVVSKGLAGIDVGIAPMRHRGDTSPHPLDVSEQLVALGEDAVCTRHHSGAFVSESVEPMATLDDDHPTAALVRGYHRGYGRQHQRHDNRDIARAPGA
jgi:hypothetical protein